MPDDDALSPRPSPGTPPALERLSLALRIVVLLRYFTGFHSYDTIARMCDVPVGTVRSRLNQARAKLTVHLRATVDRAYPDADIL